MELVDCRPGKTLNPTNDMFDYLNKEHQYPTHCVGCGAKLPMFRKPEAINTCDTICITKYAGPSKDEHAGESLMNMVESMRKQEVGHAPLPD